MIQPHEGHSLIEHLGIAGSHSTHSGQHTGQGSQRSTAHSCCRLSHHLLCIHRRMSVSKLLHQKRDMICQKTQASQAALLLDLLCFLISNPQAGLATNMHPATDVFAVLHARQSNDFLMRGSSSDLSGLQQARSWLAALNKPDQAVVCLALEGCAPPFWPVWRLPAFCQTRASKLGGGHTSQPLGS